VRLSTRCSIYVISLCVDAEYLVVFTDVATPLAIQIIDHITLGRSLPRQEGRVAVTRSPHHVILKACKGSYSHEQSRKLEGFPWCK
jgi:hypothetical protein